VAAWSVRQRESVCRNRCTVSADAAQEPSTAIDS
jgi:hypothetical protein